MRVLIIKMSSLGDVVHTLPAITDACANIPGIEFDWVVEESFAEIPGWHPGVKNVIPIAWRRWRKTLLKAQTRREMRVFFQQLRSQKYDLIIDAQGLIKSAIVTRAARGKRCGLDKLSSREPTASFAYQMKINVDRQQHAIYRVRTLFSSCLGYDQADPAIHYGIEASQWKTTPANKYLVFLHGTTWTTKLWPEDFWKKLTKLASEEGYQVFLPWGNQEEHERAIRIAKNQDNALILEKMPLHELIKILANASAIVGVDSGLTHIAAALNIPTFAIYGSTDARLTGALGQSVEMQRSEFSCSPCLLKTCKFSQQSNIFPPCYQELSPNKIWGEFLNRYHPTQI